MMYPAPPMLAGPSHLSHGSVNVVSVHTVSSDNLYFELTRSASHCLFVWLSAYRRAVGSLPAICNTTARDATRNLSWGCSTFWGKAHPPLISYALHSPPSSCTRCFSTTLNMSSLPPTHLKPGGLALFPRNFLKCLHCCR